MKTTPKGFIVSLLLAIIAILLVGGGIYVYIQNKQPAQTVTESPSVQPTTLVQEQTQTTTTTTSSDTFSENEILASLKTSWTTTQSFITNRPVIGHNIPQSPAPTWREPTRVQFISKDALLISVEDDMNPTLVVLKFDGNKFTLLETFRNKGEFTQAEWGNLVTKYGDPTYPTSTYTVDLVRNGQIVSFQTLTKVPENVFVKNYYQ